MKKAYADTILNTAKEAAARVMVSERRARGYQQELVAVRDEALRTCLRLKQMYDSKVIVTMLILKILLFLVVLINCCLYSLAMRWI